LLGSILPGRLFGIPTITSVGIDIVAVVVRVGGRVPGPVASIIARSCGGAGAAVRIIGVGVGAAIRIAVAVGAKVKLV
jgi:hypothetical protein